MSCQQASRFITNNNSNNLNLNNHKNNHNIINSNNCKSLNIQHSNNTIKGNLINRVGAGGGGGGGVTVKLQHQQQEDPYVFTESVPTTPPILFNTQVNIYLIKKLKALNMYLK